MKILLDLNIWIDVAARQVDFPESREMFKQLTLLRHEVCFPLSSYTTLFYLLNKLLVAPGAQTFLSRLQQHSVTFLPFTIQEVQTAHLLGFSDHEDACVAATGISGACDYIVTRKPKDFKKSLVSVLTPSSMLRKIL